MIRKGSKVWVMKVPPRLGQRGKYGVREGMKGEVLATRMCGAAHQYLVKLVGKGGPVSFEQGEIGEE